MKKLCRNKTDTEKIMHKEQNVTFRTNFLCRQKQIGLFGS